MNSSLLSAPFERRGFRGMQIGVVVVPLPQPRRFVRIFQDKYQARLEASAVL